MVPGRNFPPGLFVVAASVTFTRPDSSMCYEINAANISVTLMSIEEGASHPIRQIPRLHRSTGADLGPRRPASMPFVRVNDGELQQTHDDLQICRIAIIPPSLSSTPDGQQH